MSIIPPVGPLAAPCEAASNATGLQKTLEGIAYMVEYVFKSFAAASSTVSVAASGNVSPTIQSVALCGGGLSCFLFFYFFTGGLRRIIRGIAMLLMASVLLGAGVTSWMVGSMPLDALPLLNGTLVVK